MTTIAEAKSNEAFFDFLEKAARYVYEINRAVRTCNGQEVGVSSYQELPQEKKDSLMSALLRHWDSNEIVDTIESHNRWTYAKLGEGWKYGPVEDPVKKEHPNLVPYENLPWYEQMKDAIFQVIAIATEPTAEALWDQGLKDGEASEGVEGEDEGEGEFYQCQCPNCAPKD